MGACLLTVGQTGVRCGVDGEFASTSGPDVERRAWNLQCAWVGQEFEGLEMGWTCSLHQTKCA
jgi:hypothetical protein